MFPYQATANPSSTTKPAEANAVDENQAKPNFKDQVREATPLASGNLMMVGGTIPIANAMPISDSQINNEAILKLEQRNLELQRELDRQRDANHHQQGNLRRRDRKKCPEKMLIRFGIGGLVAFLAASAIIGICVSGNCGNSSGTASDPSDLSLSSNAYSPSSTSAPTTTKVSTMDPTIISSSAKQSPALTARPTQGQTVDPVRQTTLVPTTPRTVATRAPPPCSMAIWVYPSAQACLTDTNLLAFGSVFANGVCSQTSVISIPGVPDAEASILLPGKYRAICGSVPNTVEFVEASCDGDCANSNEYVCSPLPGSPWELYLEHSNIATDGTCVTASLSGYWFAILGTCPSIEQCNEAEADAQDLIENAWTRIKDTASNTKYKPAQPINPSPTTTPL